MCGRFFVSMTWEQYRALLELTTTPPESNFAPDWNAAPTHDVLLGVSSKGERRLVKMRWGLVPSWAKQAPKFATINAMCEGIEEKASYKGSLDKMRCVVPVNGFYEWRGPKGEKQPYVIRRKDGEPILLAGLWAYNPDIFPQTPRTFTIITCPANKAMSAIHERMPVILAKESLDLWLGAGAWSDEHRALLRPCPDGWLEAYPVNKDVGNVKNMGAYLADPVGDPIF
jgi:putative SOS response-associated peptidase YedK